MTDINSAPELRRRPDDDEGRMQRIINELDAAISERNGAVRLTIKFVYKGYAIQLETQGSSDPQMLARMEALARALSGLGATGQPAKWFPPGD